MIETLGPGADFRHDYDNIVRYRDRSDRASGSTGDPVDVLRDGSDLVHMWTMVRY